MFYTCGRYATHHIYRKAVCQCSIGAGSDSPIKAIVDFLRDLKVDVHRFEAPNWNMVAFCQNSRGNK